MRIVIMLFWPERFQTGIKTVVSPASHMEVSHIQIFEIFCVLFPSTAAAVAVWCPRSPALSNQSPLSQAAPRWVLQRHNERTVAEYFISPWSSVPAVCISRPVLVKGWLLQCSSLMRSTSIWACSSGQVDSCLLRSVLFCVIHHHESESNCENTSCS